MKLHLLLMMNITCFSSLLLSPVVRAEDRVGVLHYMKNSVPSGHFVCEPGDAAGQSTNCYYLNKFSRTLVPTEETSSLMKAGSISKHQGDFVEIKIDQLATSVIPENLHSSQIFDFYLKLHWKGERPGMLNIELTDSHVIKGQAIRNSEGELDFNIISVPDLYMLSMFLPRLSIAEMFGRSANTEADELERDIQLWMTLLINPVLKSYINNGLPEPINLP